MESRTTASDLAGDAEAARLARARAERDGERAATRCRRCRRALAPGKRRHARFCEPLCVALFHAEARQALRREVKAAVRAATAPTACPDCGAPINATLRPGRPAARCRRCYQRRYHGRPAAPTCRACGAPVGVERIAYCSAACAQRAKAERRRERKR